MLLSALLAVSSSFGQGFRVQPMFVEAEVQAGQTASIPLDIANLDGLSPKLMDIEVQDVSQGRGGGMVPVSSDSNISTSSLMSCREWITLEAAQVELSPSERRVITVLTKVPPSARGTYTAGLLVRSQPIGDENAAVRMQVQFFVPLILTIKGRPVLQQIELADVTLLYDEGKTNKTDPVTEGKTNKTDPVTIAAMHVANKGRTYSHVQGRLLIERQVGDRWRLVTQVEIPDRGILPGLTVELGEQLQRNLPSGPYRLRGHLSVDGRPAKSVEKVVDFEGNSQDAAFAYDASFIVEPEIIDLILVPGASRNVPVKIENPSDDTILMQLEMQTPKALQGMAMGDLVGSELSAAPWTQSVPEKFQIPPRSQRTVKVAVRLPEEGAIHANYYANFVLQGRYENGESAGEARSVLIHLANQSVAAKPSAIIEKLALAQGTQPSQYVIQTRFVNVGNVHLQPVATAELAAQEGTVAVLDLEGQSDWLLPLGIREYSGVIDLSNCEPGVYALRVTNQYAEGKQIREQMDIRVDIEEVAPEKEGEKPLKVRKATVVESSENTTETKGSSE